MHIQWLRSVSLLLALAFSTVLAGAQTSISGSVYGAFDGTSNGNGTQQSPANQAGGMFEFRHVSNPILGFEGTYSFNRADETYTDLIYPPASSSCPAPCGPYTQSLRVPANAHELTADWTPSLHIANLRPFAVLGIGLLLNVPSGNQTETTINGEGMLMGSSSVSDGKTTTHPVYVYGAGLDWGLLPHLGLRFQYRGNFYSAPDLTSLYASTGAFTHAAEPMIGVYFNL